MTDPPVQRQLGIRPTVKSVPSPEYVSSLTCKASSAFARAANVAARSRHCSTGSASSSRIALPTAVQSRSTSGSP
nr:hypothetical protein [Kribbella qitaiheensis]